VSPQDPARSQDQARVGVRILEKEYFVACPYEERSALLDAAEYLNARMKEIRDSGKVVGLDRIAVMVALNLANELMKGKERESRVDSDSVGRVRTLREKVEKTLEKSGQLDLES
jgi:cell division protein ZapA